MQKNTWYSILEGRPFLFVLGYSQHETRDNVPPGHMVKHRSIAVLAALIVAGILLWQTMRVDGSHWDVIGESSTAPVDRSVELARVRQSCQRQDLVVFLAEQQERAKQTPLNPEVLRVLAEAHLELGQFDDIGAGLKIGAPIRTTVSEQLRGHIDAGMKALLQARDLGDDGAENHRIESALLALEIHGLASAFKVNGRATAALNAAVERDGANPRVQVAIGCRLLFAPAMLGGDAERAREHLIAGAKGLPYDERPLLYAAMASWTLGDVERCQRLLEQASNRTPANPLVKAVKRRLAAREDDPFSAAD